MSFFGSTWNDNVEDVSIFSHWNEDDNSHDSTPPTHDGDDELDEEEY